jgi:tRNA A-37 threonylcarbamoyl transferase component Bud32
MTHRKVELFIKKNILLLWGVFHKFKNALYIFVKYNFIKNELIKLHVSGIKIYKFKRWHEGYFYFTGRRNGEKLFIKIDSKMLLLKNEVIANEILQKDLSDNLIPVCGYLESPTMQIIVYPYIKPVELTIEKLLNNVGLINDILNILILINKNNVIHRDVKLDNFILDGNKIKMLDFSFATAIRGINTFTELDISKRYYFQAMKFLGDGLNPKKFEWNDFYSLYKIVQQVELKVTSQDSSLENIHKILYLINKKIDGNTFKQCKQEKKC